VDPTKVDLQQLKAVICRLIDELARRTGSESFQLPEHDFYWEIPPELKLIGRDSDQPSASHVGRLRDDWEFVQKIADQPMDQMVTPYSLTEVAPLLDYMGFSVVRRSGPTDRTDGS
jgi:hypothetical protein